MKSIGITYTQFTYSDLSLDINSQINLGNPIEIAKLIVSISYLITILIRERVEVSEEK